MRASDLKGSGYPKWTKCIVPSPAPRFWASFGRNTPMKLTASACWVRLTRTKYLCVTVAMPGAQKLSHTKGLEGCCNDTKGVR